MRVLCEIRSWNVRAEDRLFPSPFDAKQEILSHYSYTVVSHVKLRLNAIMSQIKGVKLQINRPMKL
jgi:hypothetical protein